MSLFRGFGQRKPDVNDQPVVATPQNSGESSDPTRTNKNNVAPLKDFVLKQGQEKGKIVIDEGKRIISDIQGLLGGGKENFSALSEDEVRKIVEELPAIDSVANLMQNIPKELPAKDYVGSLKRQVLAEIQNSKSIQVGLNNRQRLLKGEAPAASFVIKKGQEILQGYGGFSLGGIMKNKGKPHVPSEDEVKESLAELAQLKEKTLTAIQQYNSVKESLKTIQGTLDKASA